MEQVDTSGCLHVYIKEEPVQEDTGIKKEILEIKQEKLDLPEDSFSDYIYKDDLCPEKKVKKLKEQLEAFGSHFLCKDIDSLENPGTSFQSSSTITADTTFNIFCNVAAQLQASSSLHSSQEKNINNSVTESIPRDYESCFKEGKCYICTYSSSNKANLQRHINTHIAKKPHKCEICLRSFPQKHHLIDHIRTHTGEKPYKCDTCLASFTQKYDLVRHKRVHTGEKPFSCEVCLISFSQKQTLVKHRRTHSGEKPFKCDICLNCFSQKQSLVKHKRIHSGEKPYKCDLCFSSFARKEHLVRHKATHRSENFLNN